MGDPGSVLYTTNWGPLDGPILGSSSPPALGVFGPPEPGKVLNWAIGIAYPVGLVRTDKGKVAATFRLEVHKVELEGRWLCVARSFVRLGEAAEELRG